MSNTVVRERMSVFVWIVSVSVEITGLLGDLANFLDMAKPWKSASWKVPVGL